jgi:putative peptide zinc metalloprotease protein
MNATVSSKTDLMYEITYNPMFVPRRSPRANVKTVVIEGENRYFMKNHETGTLYSLTEFGNDVWNLIDGKRTVKEINKTLANMYKDFRPDLLKDSLLYYAEEGALEAASQTAIRRKRLIVASAFMVRINLIWESSKFIASIHRLIRPFLKKSLLWLAIVFGAVFSLLFASNFVSIFTHKENFEIMGSTVIGFFFYYFIVLGPAIAIHEIAHGLALVHYGGAPREMGTGLYFFGPMFFIDVTDGWTLNRYQRIMVYAAGPLTEVLIGSAIMVAQYLWQFPALISHILTMAIFYCFYGLLIDLSPLLETDGYNMLCDALRIPELREKSFNYLKAVVTKPFKRTKEKKSDVLTTRIKTILLIYATIAAIWAVYLVYRSLIIVTYMGQDTATSVLNVSSVALSGGPITVAAIALSVASILYFSMVVSGYGVMIFTSLKKAMKKTLRFEEIHDRDLSVFLYLPKQVPESLLTSLKKKTMKTARDFTHNSSVNQTGSTCVAVLRMSGVKLAFAQIKQHFQNIEKKFDNIYESFLKRHEEAILKSLKIYSSQKTDLAFLLSEMGKQSAKAGVPEAEAVVSQVIGRQAKTALYLLRSVYGRVWTVELPPNLLHEIGETLLPTFFVEDLSITDLYDEVEDFKKHTIYGLDSLAKLAGENQRDLQQALLHPEKYQVISSFEPIKSRLIFVGRTEQIESIIESLGGLFVCQGWCGYLDNLLSEVNLGLFALSRSSLPTVKSIRSMTNGELAVLEKNLSSLIANEKSVNESMKDLNSYWKCTNRELEDLERRLKPTEGFKIGLLGNTLKINAENLTHLPSQFESFGVFSHELYARVKKIEKTVKNELDKRKQVIMNKKRRTLALSPFFIALSAVLVSVGLMMFAGYVSVMFLASAMLLQFSYWIAYLLFSRSLNTVSRYPSLAFRQVHFFAFAFTESLYEFMTANVLTPIETVSAESNQT